MRLTDVKVRWLDDSTTIFTDTKIEEDCLKPQYLNLRKILKGNLIVINKDHFICAEEVEE